MKTEKIIKTQARKSLGGNWVQMLTGCGFVFAMLLSIEYFVSDILIFGKWIDLSSGKITGFGVYISIGIILLIVVFSPFLNGVFKLAANVVETGKSEASDALYFFKGKKYFRTLGLNILIFMMFGFSSAIFDSYTIISNSVNMDLPKAISSGSNYTLLLIIGLLVTVFGTLFAFFVFVYYPLAGYALDDSRGVGFYAFRLIGFSFRHLGATLKLFLSFFGWLLLCFFVVPALYVLPYYLVSAVSSTRWLVLLDRNRGKI